MKKRFIFLIIILFTIVFANKVFAYDINKDDKIYVGGQSVGIKLENGVEVIGTYAIYEDGILYKPWDNGILIEKDIILEFNGNKILNCNDLLIALSTSDDEVDIVIKRNNKIINNKISPVKKNNTFSLGVYIKDSILGIGTLTYYIKEANIFGSLGHKINTESFIKGQIYDAKVDEIVRPTRGQAGEKKATIYGNPIGSVNVNTDSGVQGITNSKFNINNMTLLNFKTKEEVTLGKAQIWTCVRDTKIDKYDIEIIKLVKQKEKSIKGIVFKVIDEELINNVGGIIQGMSGSPIVQDEKIVGAVTHVTINDATLGYGIYLEWMFEDMGINIR